MPVEVHSFMQNAHDQHSLFCHHVKHFVRIIRIALEIRCELNGLTAKIGSNSKSLETGL